MKKSAYILFKIGTVFLLSILLTNQNYFEENDLVFAEIVEFEIEEEESLNAFYNSEFIELDSIGDDGAKKRKHACSTTQQNPYKIANINVENHVLQVVKKLVPNVPTYILHCALVVYS